MKHTLLKSILALVLSAGLPAQAGVIYTYSGSAYGIPDGNSSGVSSQITVSGRRLRFRHHRDAERSGGYNGDLYAYLSYDGCWCRC